MAANKQKQNMRFQRVSSRINKKVRYDGFSQEEIKFIKIKENYKNIEKELNIFWKTAPRLSTGSVDWKSMSEFDLNYFEHINKESEKLLKQISKLEDVIDVNKTMELFILLNINSVSY